MKINIKHILSLQAILPSCVSYSGYHSYAEEIDVLWRDMII